ncbi:hypothetical protein Csa_022264 [Cucumis sativus]|uniref:Uncharacterized protein n=1 Tax=Cucumis sativus TaxID=3659 RepID=A0A0A0LN10_CUCSA|nr:hypothetical protein Csa_022264 [Cucumis sativus]
MTIVGRPLGVISDNYADKLLAINFDNYSMVLTLDLSETSSQYPYIAPPSLASPMG